MKDVFGPKRILTSLVIACMAIATVGCGTGAATPREAAVTWSQALLNRDYATVNQYGAGVASKAQIERQRASLGLPASPNGVTVVVLGQADNDGMSEVGIGFRRDARSVAPTLTLAVWEADSAWRVAGPMMRPTPTQRSAVATTVTGFLDALASNDHTASRWLDANTPTYDLKVHRRAAFGVVDAAPLAGFRVVSVGQVAIPPVFNGWFATATVSYLQAGHPVVRNIRLSGLMSYFPGSGPRVSDALGAR